MPDAKGNGGGFLMKRGNTDPLDFDVSVELQLSGDVGRPDTFSFTQKMQLAPGVKKVITHKEDAWIFQMEVTVGTA